MAKKRTRPGDKRTTLNELFAKQQESEAIISGTTFKRDIVPFRFSSGLYAYDELLGGGIPAYKYLCLYGPENGGKTTEALINIRGVQQTCYSCFNQLAACNCSTGPTLTNALWVGIDDDFDAPWAEALGVDLDRLKIAFPDSGQEALTFAVSALDAYDCGLVVVDSLAAIAPDNELEDDFLYSERPRTQAGLLTRACNMFRYKLIKRLRSKMPAVVLVTNQVRAELGKKFGNPETTPGGHAVRHLTHYLIRTSRVSLGDNLTSRYEQDGLETVSRHMLKLHKDRGGNLVKAAEFLMGKRDQPEQDVIRGVPLDHGQVIKAAREHGVITGDGPYMLGETRYKSLKELKSDLVTYPEAYYHIQRLIFEKRGVNYYPAGTEKGKGKTCLPARSAKKQSTRKTEKKKIFTSESVPD